MNIRINFTSPKTRMIVLPDAEDRTIVSSFVWTKHRNVTDRQTERQPEQCGRAVKSITIAQEMPELRSKTVVRFYGPGCRNRRLNSLLLSLLQGVHNIL